MHFSNQTMETSKSTIHNFTLHICSRMDKTSNDYNYSHLFSMIKRYNHSKLLNLSKFCTFLVGEFNPKGQLKTPIEYKIWRIKTYSLLSYIIHIMRIIQKFPIFSSDPPSTCYGIMDISNLRMD